MKLNRSTLVLPLAGLLVIGGAGAVLATSGGGAATGGTDAVAPAAASPSPSTGTTTLPKVADRDTLLGDVLDELVTKGTINSSQKTAILDAVTAARSARQQERQAARQQLQEFLADGQITQDELDKLPADSPLRTLTTLMDDGKITTDELQQLRGGMFGGKGGRGGHGMFGGSGLGPDASPAASPTTSG